MKKLIIWDFDGVIADTEKLWLETKRDLLNERYNLNWDFDDVNSHLGGMADITKREVLDKMGIVTDDDFWAESMRRDIEKINQGLKPVEGVTEIFSNKKFDQCIATGGVYNKTILKIKSAKLEKYINTEHLYTVDMVKRGKPEPDLFLYAAEKMGYEPKNCVVIEDSLVGMTAGLKAEMTVVAFLGCAMNNNPEYIAKVKALGIKNIFFNMYDVADFLEKFAEQ